MLDTPSVVDSVVIALPLFLFQYQVVHPLPICIVQLGDSKTLAVEYCSSLGSQIRFKSNPFEPLIVAVLSVVPTTVGE